MDPRCGPGVLIGFDEGMRSYIIWDPVNQRVVRPREVSFNKGVEEVDEIHTDNLEFEDQKSTK